MLPHAEVGAAIYAIIPLLHRFGELFPPLTFIGTAYLSIQGPSSRKTLAKLTDLDLSTAALPYYHAALGVDQSQRLTAELRRLFFIIYLLLMIIWPLMQKTDQRSYPFL